MGRAVETWMTEGKSTLKAMQTHVGMQPHDGELPGEEKLQGAV